MRILSLWDSLVLLVLFTLGPAIALTFHTDAVQRKMAVEEARKDALHLARWQASNFDRVIDGARQLTTGLVEAMRGPIDTAAWQGRFRDILRQHPQYNNIAIVRPDGRVLVSALPMQRPVSAAGWSALPRALATNAFAIGDIQVGLISRRHILPLAAPIPGPGGEPVGVVIAALDMVRLSETAAAGLLPEGGALTVLDGRGTIVARHPDPQNWVGRRVRSAVATEILARGDGTTEGVDPDGVARLYGFSTLQGTRLYVAVGISEQVAFAASNHLMTRNLLLLALVGLLGVAAAYLITERLILGRLRALSLAAERLRSGDLGARADVRGGDEFGVVAATFNSMAERITAMLREEQRVRAELSERVEFLVAQRTREVEQLSEMSDMLQVSESVEDARRVLEGTLAALFPGSAGSVSVPLEPRGRFRVVASWGVVPAEAGTAEFRSEDCWALRRGQAYVVQDTAAEACCAHLSQPLPGAYVCLPLVAQGEAVGLMHIAMSREAIEGGAGLDAASRRHAASVADTLALSLANLKLRETLRAQSVRDPLTGLFNRRYMEETLERELRRAERAGQPLTVVALDLDFFKPINDRFGHDAGDTVLRGVARMLESNLRGGDVACRYGGDEFVLILPGATLDQARSRATGLCGASAGLRHFHEGHDLGAVTISLGVASYPGHGVTLEELMRSADLALYRAKQAGRGRVETAA